MISKPIRDAYWVVPNWLMAGDCLTDLAWLKGLGVSAFVDLTLEGELPSHARMLPSGVHQRFPVQDGRAPDSRELTCGAWTPLTISWRLADRQSTAWAEQAGLAPLSGVGWPGTGIPGTLPWPGWRNSGGSALRHSRSRPP